MPSAAPSIEALEHAVASLAAATTASDALAALLRATALAAPRAALFLFRDGMFRGWNAMGWPEPAASGLRSRTVPPTAPWAARTVQTHLAVALSPLEPETWPDLPRPPASEGAAVALRADGRALGLLLAERGPGEEPWSPGALRLLALAAGMRLDLDLARRRRPEPPAPPPAPARMVVSTAAPGEPAVPSGLAPVAAPRPADPADTRREEARRFARLLATDIRLYNEEAVMAGRRQGDLASRLAVPMERARQAFARRFEALGPDGGDLLREAFVQVLAAGDEALIPPR